MKKTAFIAFAMLLTTVSAHAVKIGPEGPTSVDWLLMGHQERVALVTKLISQLQSRGIALSAPVERYVDAITTVTEDPKLKKNVPVSNILMSIAYAKEPAVRGLLDQAKAEAKAKAKQKAAATTAVPGDRY
jgi:hypothetical protein